MDCENISVLWNSRDEQLWLTALENYWQKLSGEQLLLERKMDSLKTESVRFMSVDEFFSFLYEEFYVWKYTNKFYLTVNRKQLWKYFSEKKMNELELIKEELFSLEHTNIKKCLSCAKKLRGLGTAGASALLSILFPSDFGTVDQFVVKSLLKISNLPEHERIEQMNPESLKLDDGVLLVNIMKNKAEELNEIFVTDFWTPRKIDMILWSIGR